ncbi:MAG: NADH-quinone oxidoreductase subunit I [Syntrophomonadaceae bacterium]|nr:NADH-quinone oxidoreductase subunit I [Syntrophomonadaceae bacterium]
MYGIGLLKGLKVTLKHFFGQHVTQYYPEERPNLPPRFHGCLTFEPDACIVCGICQNVCPNRAITIKSEKGGEDGKKKILTEYRIDLKYCMFCGLCLEACPKGGLRFTDEFELATYHVEEIGRVLYRKKVEE